MTKEEALKQIEELKKYVEKCDRPDPKVGQVWEIAHSGRYLMAKTKDGLRLIHIEDFYDGAIGNRWSDNSIFDDKEDQFTYVGMFKDLYLRKAQ